VKKVKKKLKEFCKKELEILIFRMEGLSEEKISLKKW